jgi:outer membrane protein TolC
MMMVYPTKAVTIVLLLMITRISFSNNDTIGSQQSKVYPLTLEQAISLAVTNDIWLKSNQSREDSLKAKSIAVGSMPDPKFSIGIANLASDSFNFAQEPMTQLKLGVSQMFPRGNSRELKKQKLKDLANGHSFQRLDRSMKLAVNVGHLWLDAFKAEQSIVLINKDRELFEQLVEIAEASYTTAIGKTRQQDLIRSQLELTLLEDRLTVLLQKQETSMQELNQWLNDDFVNQNPAIELEFKNKVFSLDNKLPSIFLNVDWIDSKYDSQRLYETLSIHPLVNSINQEIIASQTNIELSKQKYKPAFAVNSSYGYRDNAPTAGSRADLFSVGVSFDLPLFTKNKQDKEVQSAIFESESIESNKWQLLRNMMASFEKNITQLQRLTQRQKLYQQKLLPQMHEQAQASLTAYTNDDGDFSEVVRSRIAVLNAEIDALEINIDKQKKILKLNYFLNNNYKQMISNQPNKEVMK